MSTDRVSIRVTVDSSPAEEKLADLWWAAARLAHPLMSEDELEELARTELGQPAMSMPGRPAPPDWYDEHGIGAQICPQCTAAETDGTGHHCDGWTSFCECDCTS